MGPIYFCKNKRRRQAVSRPDSGFNGIDHLEVLDTGADALASPRQRTLLVHCFKTLPAGVNGDHVEIHGGVRVTDIRVQWAVRADQAAPLVDQGCINAAERDFFMDRAAPQQVLVVRTDASGDFSTYRLHLVSDDAPLAGFDRKLAQVDFCFKVQCPSEFDCAAPLVCPPPEKTPVPVDYLARDYAGFRQLMLDRLAVLMPNWQDRNPADNGIALVETLAFAADQLSYFQDAVATEAYLGTARQRPSLRRHARLLDYAMHEGCNARAWIALRADAGIHGSELPVDYAGGRKTCFLTRMPGQPVGIDDAHVDDLLRRYRPSVFEPLFAIRLYSGNNTIRFHTWGDEQCCLPAGATAATLAMDPADPPVLAPGDVLIFEEILGSATGRAADADPAHRHAVRLTRVEPGRDDLLAVDVIEIQWARDDALPFPLCLSTLVTERYEEVLVPDLTVACGNVVLADYGRSIGPESLPAPDGDLPYRPYLAESDVTYAHPLPASQWAIVDEHRSGFVSAGRALSQSPREALPAVAIEDHAARNWSPVIDLMDSDRFDCHFVVEVHNDRRPRLRFGDNTYGRLPAKAIPLAARYRLGNGPSGNVGADTIAHIVTVSGVGLAPAAPADEAPVRNPLPATGGTEPEAMEQVRLSAPQAFRTQARAVTARDYEWVARQHPQVSKAVARRLWTGSWHTMFITVDRVGGRAVDADFESELVDFIRRYQLAGHDVEIAPPEMVALDIAMRVCVAANYLAADVKLALLETFGCQDLPDGRRGYFHPDNHTFGQPVYLSDMLAAAMAVAGVKWVDMDTAADPPARFQRWGQHPRKELQDGLIPMGRMEIARLDNDPNAPENGRLEFHMEGGI